MQRRLAILAADVAGYSRLMAADDRATVAALDAGRAVFRRSIESEDGRIIDMAGDSVLATFESVSGAMRAAVTIQRELARASESVPEERRMRFRIGMHVGDVIQQPDGTVYGTGVNIAARLEGLAEPGGICVSDAIRAGVVGPVGSAAGESFVDLGEQRVKNIPEPVRAHRVVATGLATVPSALAAPSLEPSIAVLPFDNMSGDVEQEYFADGITEDIITELARISGLLVIARNSTFALKKQRIDIVEVGRRFGVRHVLEGSVRKVGSRVRITAQLIDAATGAHVWAERYDRELEDIFAVQDEVSASIVGRLQVELTPAERAGLTHRKGKVDIAAYDLAIRARAAMLKFSREGLAEARELYREAIAIDPQLAQAYGGLALIYPTEFINNWATGEELPVGMAYAQRALELDPEDANGLHARTLIALMQKDFVAADLAAARAIELIPSDIHSLLVRGQVFDFTSQYVEAIACFEKARRTDPAHGLTLQLLGRAQFGARRYDDAIESFRRRLVQVPHSDMTRAYLASIFGIQGKHDEARRLWAEILAIDPAFSIEKLRRTLPYQHASWFAHFADGLAAAGIADARDQTTPSA